MAGNLLLSSLSLLALASVRAAAAPTDKYDYIIIGGGPAGFVVAEYLTRNPKVKVALLEAGPDIDSDPNIYTPGRVPFNQKGINLMFVEPDPELDGRTPDLGQGAALGGGSAINSMIYCRGSASVFDEWAQVSGNPNLAWPGILNAFKATTNYQDEPTITYHQPLNTTVFGNGPLAVSRQRQLFAVDEPLVNAWKSQLDLPEIDFVSGGGIGVSQGLNAIRASNRTRSYAYNAWGYKANTRPNFKLQANAIVSKIGFTGTKADSVTYNNTLTSTLTTLRTKEVIVAAGAVKSPQLLMLSGVGPASTLASLSIPVVKNIPAIGQNLVDHHNVLLGYSATPAELTYWQYTYNSTVRTQADAQYAANGDGILGIQWGDVIAAHRLPDSAWPAGVNVSFYKNLPADRPHVAYEYTNIQLGSGTPNISSIAAWASLIQPEGTGNITLRSANYLDPPKIYANYFGTPADRAAILYGYRQLREILNDPGVKTVLPEEIFPGAEVTSDEGLWEAIQQTARSWHHPVGTVALGSVLDKNWRIKGLKGIRVVGSAAIPYISTCPILSTVYAVGHVAAVDIARADKLGI